MKEFIGSDVIAEAFDLWDELVYHDMLQFCTENSMKEGKHFFVTIKSWLVGGLTCYVSAPAADIFVVSELLGRSDISDSMDKFQRYKDLCETRGKLIDVKEE